MDFLAFAEPSHYVIACYTISAVAILSLTSWVIIRANAQKKRLAELEKKIEK